MDTTPYRNRLLKNARHWGKWARRQQISCYRLYDREIPEFPLVVDRYGDHLHLQEVDTGWEQSDAEHQAWQEAVCLASAEVLELPRNQVHIKLRQRQKGIAQYEKAGQRGENHIVTEGGLRFWVNLDTYLDTGLFLDHRPTRALVRSLAAGKRVLNLFAYTGSFSVYAAAGGARETVTVDLSHTYLDWARRNFLLNGLLPGPHQLVQADAFAWLREAVTAGERFDLIVMDPPSFSNSKRMLGVLDVQRDHPWLLAQCLTLLQADGDLFFSTNRRGFTLSDALPPMQIRDISHQSVPEDFRNRKIHQCWRIRHAG